MKQWTFKTLGLLFLFSNLILTREPREIAIANRDSLTQKKIESDIQLLAQVVEKRYCTGSSKDDNTLRVTIKLEYKNTGIAPIVLYKGQHLVSNYSYASDFTLSNSMEEVSLSYYPSQEKLKIDSSEPNNQFIKLSLNESFITLTYLTLATTSLNKKATGSALSPGNYTFKLSVITFPLNADISASLLKEKWQPFGFLLSSAKSSLFKVIIDAEKKFENC